METLIEFCQAHNFGFSVARSAGNRTFIVFIHYNVSEYLNGCEHRSDTDLNKAIINCIVQVERVLEMESPQMKLAV